MAVLQSISIINNQEVKQLAYVLAGVEPGLAVVAAVLGLVAASDGDGCEESHETENDLGGAHGEDRKLVGKYVVVVGFG